MPRFTKDAKDGHPLQTLISVEDVGGNLPALAINGKTYYGFQSVDAINKILPQLATIARARLT